MKVKDVSGVKVYDLTVGKTLPQWLSEKQKRSLAKDEEYRRRIELVQDFYFNTASQRVKMSRDNSHIVVTGTYPPMVKVYDVRELSLKFDRHLDAEVVQFEILSDDYAKLVFLGADRSLNFHAAYGTYYSTRVPSFGRDMLYNRGNCDLYVCGASRDVYRLNLEQGCFLTPFETQCPAVNTMALSPHQLLAMGGENGVVECWDPRAKKNMAALDVSDAVNQFTQGITGTMDHVNEVTALSFDESGLLFAAGTYSGHCLLYDLRSSKPLIVKEHQYNLPIINLKFQQGGENVVSTDAKVIKIWNKNDGSIFTNVESENAINDVAVVDGPRGSSSGLFLVASEQDRVKSFYVPQFGPAPKWASFLDNLTEELEENEDTAVYDDYKFVTKQDIEQLGVSHLLGTPLLKPYMHGFFMDLRLYNRVKAISEPFAYEEWRKSKIKEKLEKKRAARIQIKSKLPQVNRKTAERLIQDSKSKSKKKKAAQPDTSVMADSRFSSMFKDADFEIDEESENFKLVNPSGVRSKPQAQDLDMDSDMDVSDDDDAADQDMDVSEDDAQEESDAGDSYYDDDDDEQEPVPAKTTIKTPKKIKAPVSSKTEKKRRLLKLAGDAIKDDGDVLALDVFKDTPGKGSRTKRNKNAVLGERVAQDKDTEDLKFRKLTEGNFEITFAPSSGTKKTEDATSTKSRKKKRR